MQDLFNPAGLCMLEDREGAIAYGFVAPRVFFARFVGNLSGNLGTSYVRRLEAILASADSLAYFGDASALRAYDLVARTRFQSLVTARRAKFSALVFLTWETRGLGPTFTDALGDAPQIYADPAEFDRVLSNVAPVPRRSSDELGHLWQVSSM
jgi:hypothetical protein